jgi:hypothetical protein
MYGETCALAGSNLPGLLVVRHPLPPMRGAMRRAPLTVAVCRPARDRGDQGKSIPADYWSAWSGRRDALSRGPETLGAPPKASENNHAVALRQFRSRPQMGQVGRSCLRTPLAVRHFKHRPTYRNQHPPIEEQ